MVFPVTDLPEHFTAHKKNSAVAINNNLKRCDVSYKFTDISEKRTVSIFRVKGNGTAVGTSVLTNKSFLLYAAFLWALCGSSPYSVEW
jgi:beta-N-acetylglucosaminidase